MIATHAPTLESIRCATVRTFGMLLGAEPEAGPFEARATRSLTGAEVRVIVGFAGDTEGQLALGLSKAQAADMAGQLMGMPCDGFDEMAHSAVAEIANMIAGACATELHGMGVIVNITVPSVVVGDHLEVSWPHLAIHEVALQLTVGQLMLAVGLKHKA